MRLARSEPCPPTPTIITLVVFILITSSLDGAERAFLVAYTAANAKRCVDDSLLILEADRGTADLHAGTASAALVRIHLLGRILLHGFQKDARTAGDDDGWLLGGELLLQHLIARGEIVRIDDGDAADTDRVAQRLQIDLAGGIAVDVHTRGRVLLVTGHAGDGVIKDDHGGVGFIVSGIFEINPRLIGIRINDIEVMDYENIVEYVEENHIDIGIICTTKDAAQEVADKLCFAGVKGLWNFAPVDIETPDHVAVENMHISDSLHSLAYHMNKIAADEEDEK